MHINQGKFRQNGNCGYVLKPKFMLQGEFNPSEIKDLEIHGVQPITLNISVWLS